VRKVVRIMARVGRSGLLIRVREIGYIIIPQNLGAGLKEIFHVKVEA